MSISLVDVARYYQELPSQNQALLLLQAQIESTQPELLADSSDFAKTWRNQTPSASTQASTISISLVEVAKYYQELPYQNKALQLLQTQIESKQPDLLADYSGFIKIWRDELPSSFPKVQVISNGTQLKAKWRGKTYTIDANKFTARILDSFDPETGNMVDREMSGQRFVSNAITVDPKTGNIVIGVLLAYYAATDFSAVFIIKPEDGGYSIYRSQVPGSRPLPDELSTYALKSIKYVRFLDENLLVKHGDAAGQTTLVVFRPSKTPAMQYAGAIALNLSET